MCKKQDQTPRWGPCRLWLVARDGANPDAVWVQELWDSEQAAEAALAGSGGGDGPSPQDVLALCDGPPRRTDLTPVGGVGFDRAA